MKRLSRQYWLAVGALLAIHATLLFLLAVWNSPTIDEVGHLPAGIAVYEYGRFDLYRVNPPLIKALAAVPAAVGGAETGWSQYYESDFGRPEWAVGQAFVSVNEGDWFRWYKYARWAVLPLSLLGALVCYQWSRELYGEAAGVLSLAMWCFSPNVLAWGSTITPDMGATSLGLLAGWRFWHWLKEPTWNNASLGGLTLGLAELAKMTWVILFLLWPIMWLAWRRLHCESATRPQMKQSAFVLLLGLYILNVGYGFDGSFRKLGDYKFGSRILAGEDNILDHGQGGNRFRGTWLERIPIPVPREYLRGIDLQRIDFEKKLPSYLNGEWKEGGWWYYYFVVIVLKVPLGYWLIALMASLLTIGDARFREQWKDELILLVSTVAVFALVSSQTGFSRYLRYILPCFPPVFIWCGKVAQAWRWNRKATSAVAAIGLVWGIGSGLSVFPHSMSYFNELAGGPHGGHRYLLDANIDWGQDLFYLKQWYDEHPEARPIITDLKTFIDEKHYGIDAARSSREPAEWYAVSIHNLFEENSRYEWLRKNHEPVAKAGYSIWIFHVPDEKRSQELP